MIDSLLHTCAGKYDSCPNYKHYNKDTTLLTTDIVYYTLQWERTLEEYTMLEESNAFTMIFLDLSSLQTNVYTRLRITDWQHCVFVTAQVALVLSHLDNPMYIFSRIRQYMKSFNHATTYA